jgi:hypothetical protein
MGDFVVALALSSAGARDLWHAPAERGQITSVAAGTAGAADRLVEARIPWRAITGFASNGRDDVARKLAPVAPGLRFGCDPMLIEFNHKTQSYIGGAHYHKPTGRDENSRDVVLR